LQTTATRSARGYQLLFLSERVVLVFLGALAAVIPLIAGSAVISALGWLFLISGLVGLATTLWAWHLPRIFWSLVSALLRILVGVALITQIDLYTALAGWPLATMGYLKEGVASIVFASEQRSRMIIGSWVQWIVPNCAFSAYPVVLSSFARYFRA
jgi:uncharacterized membrane protein HdeD (DUF308 family)